MPEDNTLTRGLITVAAVRSAMDVITVAQTHRVEGAPPPCDWPKLCTTRSCTYPRYSRDGEPLGLVSLILIQLGYPIQLLKDLDHEHEVGEVIHPGVKIHRSRNQALSRIDSKGVALLSFVQTHQESGQSTWINASVKAFTPPALRPAFIDKKRRPWLY